MNKKYAVFKNKDSADVFIQSLNFAEFQQVKRAEDANFLLFDVEGVLHKRQYKAELLRRRVGFVYPHTPMTCYIWDGIYKPLPVACNFVAGEGAKQCMKIYGYPYRVETCGFPRCDVLEFSPTLGRNLLFVPARPRRDKGRQEKLDRAAWDFIRSYAYEFESITVCRLAGQFDELQDGENGNVCVITTNPKHTKAPALDMICRLDAADLVIAMHTPAALSVARGRPTIMYGQDSPLETITGQRAKKYLLYNGVYAYPLSLEKMTINQVLQTCKASNESVEAWKHMHIGGNFDRDAFLSVIKEYV